MQVDASISVFSSGITSPIMSRITGSQPSLSGLQPPKVPAIPLDAGATLTELPAQPALSASASDARAATAVLRDSTGSGSVPIQMAAAIYTLNLSFDIQALALDLLA